MDYNNGTICCGRREKAIVDYFYAKSNCYKLLLILKKNTQAYTIKHLL